MVEKTLTQDKKNIIEKELKGSTGYIPYGLVYPSSKVWEEEYSNLSFEKKILLETQEQTRLTRKISDNVVFFFWFIILNIILYLIFVLNIFDKFK